MGHFVCAEFHFRPAPARSGTMAKLPELLECLSGHLQLPAREVPVLLALPGRGLAREEIRAIPPEVAAKAPIKPYKIQQLTIFKAFKHVRGTS
jgi:hypothetical protein